VSLPFHFLIDKFIQTVSFYLEQQSRNKNHLNCKKWWMLWKIYKMNTISLLFVEIWTFYFVNWLLEEHNKKEEETAYLYLEWHLKISAPYINALAIMFSNIIILLLKSPPHFLSPSTHFLHSLSFSCYYFRLRNIHF
jgi:hypothetical protein